MRVSLKLPAKQSDHGFTLIELLLYVAILSGLLLSVTLFFGLSNDARVKSSVTDTVNGQGLFAMDYITAAIRGATNITAPVAAASGASLSLVVPTAANSPTVFTVSNGTLYVAKGTAAATPLTSALVTVSNLTFSNYTRSGTNGIVRVSFTLSSSNTTGRAEYNYSNSFSTSAELSW